MWFPVMIDGYRGLMGHWRSFAVWRSEPGSEDPSFVKWRGRYERLAMSPGSIQSGLSTDLHI